MKSTFFTTTLLGLAISSVGAFSLTDCANTNDYHNYGSNADGPCKTFRVNPAGGWYYSSKAGCKLTVYAGSSCDGASFTTDQQHVCQNAGFNPQSVKCVL
ncbi:hypothetical protein F4814DRAFT_447890 [Daldinia grandis]|nr:hypothetical protein F4814DRAFT_447890 [Daldinia grandis]